VTVSSVGVEVPHWFADGSGYLIAERLVGNRLLVKEWQNAAVVAASEMKNPADFLQERISQDKAGLVSYGFLGSLPGGTKQMGRLIQSIRQGSLFEEAFASVYSMTPAQVIEQAFGREGQNERRNR
jgi:hypothetical protein